MKCCSGCKQMLPMNDFYFKSRATGRRQSICKTCCNAYARSHYQKHPRQYARYHRDNDARYRARNRQLIAEYLMGHPCVDCGESDPTVLEFDHIHGDKHGNLSEMVTGGYSERRISSEIEKCEIRCANCHRRKTAVQFKWFNKQIGA